MIKDDIGVKLARKQRSETQEQIWQVDEFLRLNRKILNLGKTLIQPKNSQKKNH